MSPAFPPTRPSAPRSTGLWLAMCAVLGSGSILVWLAGDARTLRWQAAFWSQRPWTLWTAGLVHLGGAHLAANLLALGAVALLGQLLRAGPVATLAWLVAWPLGTLGLLLWPGITAYSGLSGPIHAGVGVLWAWCAMNSGAKPWSFMLFCALALKLLTEQAWAHPVVYSPDWGFNVVVAAHLASALCGAGLGLASVLVSRAANFLHQRRS